MLDLVPKIRSALGNIGLDAESITSVMAGGELYGDQGVLDSLDFVRFVSELSHVLENSRIDLFALIETLDANLSAAFQSVHTLSGYLRDALTEVAQ
jgi:hypothetical protein